MYKWVALIAVCFFLFIVWIIYLANTGGSSVFFDFIRSVPYGDKWGHLGLFGFLALMAIVGSNFRAWVVGQFKIYYGAIVVAVFVLGEELSQAFIPSRTFDLIDLAADSLGIAIAVGIAYIAERFLKSR
jgi:VanZ family protein